MPVDQSSSEPPPIAAPIVTRNLTRRFDGVVAVDRVTLTVEPGELFGLIGSNGAGKSTLIKMLTTLLPPSEGTALVAGYDVAKAPAEVRRHIGYVPQLLSADGALTGHENMLLSARLYGIPSREREAKIEEALAALELTGEAHRLVRHYSGGMIRRLEIAQSMLHRPAVMFLDEPTVGLDPIARKAVWDHVRMLRDKTDTTILITTHYMEEAEELCNRVALMSRGRIAVVGTPVELKSALGPNATMDDVFAHHTGAELEVEGALGEARRTRLGVRHHG